MKRSSGIRRRPKIAKMSGLAALLFCCGAASAIAAQAAPAASAPRFTHPRDISNPYLPLGSLQQDVLEGREGGKRVRVERTARPELRQVFKVGNHDVEALAIEDRDLENGQLAELTVDYFAQADDGTIYYLGEKVDEYRNGKVVGHEGAWLFGADTTRLTPILPGHPRVGDRFRSEDVSKTLFEEDEVVSVSEAVTVPFGTYHDCVKIRETLADGSTEYKYYARGAGCIREASADGDLLLSSHTTRRAAPATAPGKNRPTPAAGGAPPVDGVARAALSYVGADPAAEAYWFEAINDPQLPADERQNLIEDLNEDGLSDPKHPAPVDLPLIMNRLWLIENVAPLAMDWVNADAFLEAYKDLLNLADVAMGYGQPVR